MRHVQRWCGNRNTRFVEEHTIIGRLSEGKEPSIDERGTVLANAIYFKLRDERRQPLGSIRVQMVQMLL